MIANNPKRIYIFSGKRKSGKDYFTEKLLNRLTAEIAANIKLSSPIKHHWACENGLKYDDLLSSDEYKEAHRKNMVDWSEKIRNEDYGYFCKAALQMSKAEEKPIWVVSDARRKTDLKWFKENYPNERIRTFRIVSNEKVRSERGWHHTPGIDDMETECGLDDITDWDEVIHNNGIEPLDPIIFKIVEDAYNNIELQN